MFRNPLCVWCHEELTEESGWKSLLLKMPERVCCESCAGLLKPITGKTCRICSRELETDSDELCFDCLRWERDPEWEGILAGNVSLFHYDDAMKEMLAKYKYRGDYALASLFRPAVKACLSRIEYDCLVPIPLSTERLAERGFNQTEGLIEGLVYENLLVRKHSEKQSKKTRRERLGAEAVFRAANPVRPPGKSIVLVDDIYTTGATLRQAARVLKQAGAVTVRSVTLAR